MLMSCYLGGEIPRLLGTQEVKVHSSTMTSSSVRRREVEGSRLYKADCERRALRWVECLLEPDISKELLEQASQHITQNHYDDVVEERNIERLCGYPMCDRKLGPISRQKYHISVERRQVFDLTERKKYCSGECYKASKFFWSQLSAVPVWARDGQVITVKLLPPASRTTETEQAISQGGDVCSPSSGDPPPHGVAAMTADTQSSPGFADLRLDTQSSPGIAAMRLDTQPRELDSVGQSLRSLQLVEHSTVCDQSTVAVAEQNTPTAATCPVSTVTVTSSMGKLQRAMSNWCTPATWAYLQGDDKVGEGGGRGEEKLEPPFLPAVHSVGQAQLQRNIFMQQLKRNLSEIDGYLTGVTAHQVLPALTELVRTFKFDRHNITFRPAEWKVILVVLIQSVHPESDVVQCEQVNGWLSRIQASHGDLALMLSIFRH